MKILITLIFVINLYSMSLEESLRTNTYQIKESEIKYYDSKHFEKKKGYLIIHNRTNKEAVIRLVDNMTQELTVDIFLNGYKEKEIFKIPEGKYETYYIYGKNFLNFKKLFKEYTQKSKFEELITFEENYTYKHLCSIEEFKEDFSLDIGQYKNTSTHRMGNINMTGQGKCITKQEIYLSKNPIF